MKKSILAMIITASSFAALADTVTILSVKSTTTGYDSTSDGAIIGGVASAVDGGDGWDIVGSAIGGAIIGSVVSDEEQAIEIRIKNAKGRKSTIVQTGSISSFKLGSAELVEINHNGKKSYRVEPNA